MKKMMKSIIYLCLILVFLFPSCEHKISYEAPVFQQQYVVIPRVLNDDYLFRYAHQPQLFDSLLIVGDMNDANNVCLFNRYSGALIEAFGEIGNGPGELVTPMGYSVDYQNGYLYINDYGRKSLLQYDLKEVQDGTAPPFREIKLSGEIGERSKILHLKDSFFVAESPFCRLLIATPEHTIQKVMQTFDGREFETDKDWFAFMNTYSCQAISPDGRKYVSATMFGGILEIYTLEGDTMERSAVKYFYKPIFDKKGIVYNPTPETIYGFCCLSATDKFLYATVHGTVNPTSMPTAVWKFDWDGNPVASFECGCPIENFTVDEESGLIYATVYNKEGELYLASMDMPALSGSVSREL